MFPVLMKYVNLKQNHFTHFFVLYFSKKRYNLWYERTLKTSQNIEHFERKECFSNILNILQWNKVWVKKEKGVLYVETHIIVAVLIFCQCNVWMQRDLDKPITVGIICSCSVFGSPKCLNSASVVIFISQRAQSRWFP